MSDEQNQTTGNNIDQVQIDLDEALKQAQANLDGWKRTAADFENYKKRKEAENQELVEFAKEVTVVKLLPSLDSLEQALRHMPQYSGHLDTNSGNSDYNFQDQYQNWQKGIEILLKQLDKVLEELGVKKIEAVGKKFDPHFHEAVREAESNQEKGIVVEELQSGFELNGKVIRPSQVIISKK